MEGWETIDVFDVDLGTLQTALHSFHRAHPEIEHISDVYISSHREEFNRDDDPYSVPESGYVDLFIVRKDNETLQKVDIARGSIPYQKIVRLRPESAISLAKERGLIVKSNEGENEALPALRRVWDLVGDLDMKVVEQALSRRLREARRE